MKYLKIASVVLAIHVTMLSLFFFKPSVQYFGAICVSTVLVWGTLMRFKRGQLALIIVGAILQLCVQRFAYNLWMPEHTGLWWPLAQFVALQYIVAVRLVGRED